jgi:FMN phosphatase YigB (HAD superfamily)
MSYVEAERVNRSRYPIHGHTALVLEKDYGIPCKPASFNDIYTKTIDYAYVRSMLTKQDIEYARDIMKKLQHKDATTFIFTNAPRQWVQELDKVLKLPVATERVIGSDQVGHFKPDPRAYAEAEFFVRLVLPNVESFCLVDDSVNNVKTAMVLPRWKGMLFD